MARGDNLRGKDSKDRAKKPKGAVTAKTKAADALFKLTSGSLELKSKIAEGKFQSPMAFLVGIYQSSEHELDVRMEAAKQLMPYFHRKQPVRTDVSLDTNETITIVKRIIVDKAIQEATDDDDSE